MENREDALSRVDCVSYLDGLPQKKESQISTYSDVPTSAQKVALLMIKQNETDESANDLMLILKMKAAEIGADGLAGIQIQTINEPLPRQWGIGLATKGVDDDSYQEWKAKKQISATAILTH